MTGLTSSRPGFWIQTVTTWATPAGPLSSPGTVYFDQLSNVDRWFDPNSESVLLRTATMLRSRQMQADDRLLARKDELLGEIREAEALLSGLEAEQARVRTRLAALRAELVAQGQAEPGIRVPYPMAAPQPVPRSPEEKVRLFRQLFRGRGDVFPTRFESRKTGKPGYAPACTNKFVRGVCELPKVKCGECPNQAFVPVDDPAVLSHLQGRHVMGVYPLLEDQTCWFLAVDFDKRTWEEDVLAFVATSRDVGLPAAVLAVALWKWCPRLVLLSGARSCRDRPEDGLPSDHRDDVPTSRTVHGFLRSAVPEPGHDAEGWLREPDRAAPSARAPTTGELGVPR